MPYAGRCPVDVSRTWFSSLHMTSASSPRVSLLACWHPAGLATVVPKPLSQVQSWRTPLDTPPNHHHQHITLLVTTVLTILSPSLPSLMSTPSCLFCLSSHPFFVPFRPLPLTRAPLPVHQVRMSLSQPLPGRSYTLWSWGERESQRSGFPSSDPSPGTQLPAFLPKQYILLCDSS